MKDWRYNFLLENIEKGYDLYYRGYVNHLKYDQKRIIANVGKEKVKIDLIDGIVSKTICTCQNNYCAHQAAILIAYEQRGHLFQDHFYTSDQLISKLSIVQKNEILQRVFDEYAEFKKDANLMLGNEISKIDEQLYELHQLIYQYNKDGVIYPLQLYVHSFIDRTKNREDYPIYQLLIHRLKMINGVTEVTILMTQILEDLSIYIRKYPEYQLKFFEFLKLDLDNEIILDFLFNYFRYEPYLSYKLDLINRLIKKVDAYQAWGRDYYLERYLLKKVEVLYDLKNDQEMNNILNECYNFPKIREFFIVAAIQNKDFDTAISLIEDSQRLDSDNLYLLIQYQNYLIDLYEKINPNKYFEALKKQLFELDKGSFEIYLKFKKICPASKWGYYLNQLLQMDLDETRLLDILFEEQQYRLLFKQIIETNNIYYLEKKKHLLMRRCPREFEEVYRYLINKM